MNAVSMLLTYYARTFKAICDVNQVTVGSSSWESIKSSLTCFLLVSPQTMFFSFCFPPLPLSQGCWRKIIVDDTMPFGEDENLLLPATTCQNELWPMLLAKAIIKLANTRYVLSSHFCFVLWSHVVIARSWFSVHRKYILLNFCNENYTPPKLTL